MRLRRRRGGDAGEEVAGEAPAPDRAVDAVHAPAAHEPAHETAFDPATQGHEQAAHDAAYAGGQDPYATAAHDPAGQPGFIPPHPGQAHEEQIVDAEVVEGEPVLEQPQPAPGATGGWTQPVEVRAPVPPAPTPVVALADASRERPPGSAASDRAETASRAAPAGAAALADRPEVLAGAAFVGGIVVAQIIKRLGHH